MNIGTSVPLPAYTIDPAFMARKAEELGFDSIWYAEHPILPVHSDSPFPSGGPIPETYAHFSDPYISLARASSVTTTIKLATGITLVPERNPWSWPRPLPPSTVTVEAGLCSASAPVGTGRRRKSWAGTSTTAGPRPGKRWPC